jgi:hypothetical protein
MNRRKFIVSAAVVASLPVSTLGMTGCSVNAKDLLNAAIDSALAIVKVADTAAPWLPDLQSAITAVQNAEAAWQSGSASTIVVDALNTLEAVLAVIPATAAFSPLIAILVAGIEAVMSAFNVTLTPVQAAKVARNPYKGATNLNKPHFLQTYQGAYKSQWNNEAKSIGLTTADI